MGKGLNDLRDENFEVFKDKGWLDNRSVPEDIALMHSELSEALEDHRAGKKPAQLWYEQPGTNFSSGYQYPPADPTRPDMPAGPLKPCGIPSEMADVIIRILNFAAMHSIDIEKAVLEKMAFNATRPHRHGNKAL